MRLIRSEDIRFLAINDRPDAVRLDAKTYEKHLRAFNLAKLLAEGEADVAAGRVRSARSVLRELKRAHGIAVSFAKRRKR